MKLAFIVQRYGTEILGGSEYHCRLVAERLAERHDVEVLTTCARDYVTWKNEYPEGLDRIRGLDVRRFPTTEMRDIAAFNRYSDWIFRYPHTAEDEQEWLRMQGPWAPGLIEHLERRHQDYDALVFFTYLYAPAVLGLKIAPAKSLLVPTAHDEPAIRLSLYRDVFASPAGIAYNTDVERRFLLMEFDIQAAVQEVVGCGVDAPGELATPRPAADEARGLEINRDEDAERDAAADRIEQGRFRVGGRGTVFRRRHRLPDPFVLYGGRIDPGKGCEELLTYFRHYVEDGGTATLVLMGAKLMPIPDEPWLRFAGRLSDEERFLALEAATVVVVPSPFESLSLLALEAFSVGTPILANARSEVLADHCTRSNAGLYYGDRDEFVEAMKLLLADSRLRRAMGRNGRDYVRKNYRWDVILSKYDRMLAKIRSGRGAGELKAV
jgi:glycosyltransferase involved in cell wall biosynthesis